MALTTDQIDSLEILKETKKIENELSNRVEMIRIARDILIENARNSPVNERNITVEEVVSMANSLMNFVDNQ